jgi:hypothetical protein
MRRDRNESGLMVVCGMRPKALEAVAARMLARDGLDIIGQLHLRAAASYDRGNWLPALALVGIADTARAAFHNQDNELSLLVSVSLYQLHSVHEC